MTDLPPMALESCFHVGFRLPPPWFLPVEAPACGAVLDIPAEKTNDGVARRFVCDRPRGHTDHHPEPGTRHRQVTDNEAGSSFTWPTDFEWPAEPGR
jgi:hypothetical protein